MRLGATGLSVVARRYVARAEADAVYVNVMLELLKKGPSTTFIPVIKPWLDDWEQTRRIRCPLCEWQPPESTLWACQSYGTPEPYFGGCGTLWNTFSTGGKCPGCSHQWKWTSCPNCHDWSLHEDWYEDD